MCGSAVNSQLDNASFILMIFCHLMIIPHGIVFNDIIHVCMNYVEMHIHLHADVVVVTSECDFRAVKSEAGLCEKPDIFVRNVGSTVITVSHYGNEE